MEAVILLSLVILVLVATPIAFIWGWTLWLMRREQRDRSASLSFAGFLFATAAALLAGATLAYAGSIGFPCFDPRLIEMERCGLALGVLAVTLSALGTARPNLIRWQSLASSCGMFLFCLGSILCIRIA